MPKRKRQKGISLKRVTGITKAKRTIARKTGIPTTRAGRQRKFGKIASGGCLVLVLKLSLFVSLTAFAISALM